MKPRGEGKLPSGLNKHRGQPRHHEYHHRNAHHRHHGKDERGIHHGAANSTHQVVIFFPLIGEVAQNIVEMTRRFSGAHHIDVKIVEDFGVAPERLRQARTAVHVVRNF